MKNIKSHLNKIREESEGFKKEIKGKVIGYITAAFGLVAGLAWNEAVKALIEYLFPLSANGLLAKFLYAVLMTIVVVVISAYLVRFIGKSRKDV